MAEEEIYTLRIQDMRGRTVFAGYVPASALTLTGDPLLVPARLEIAIPRSMALDALLNSLTPREPQAC